MSPLVSIIMPCHNAAEHLPVSVGSIQQQSSGDWELIVIDDGSTDTSASWLRAQSDPRICVLTQANQGVSAARNVGLRHARGQYLAFLDADDAWDPAFLEKMAATLQARPEVVLAYCGWRKVRPNGKQDAPFIPPDYETADKATTLFAGCRWPIHAALVRRAAVMTVGGFDERLSNAEDYLLWLSLLAEGHQAFLIDLPLAYSFKADFGEAGLSSHLWRMHSEVLDTYRRLQQAGHLGGALRMVLTLYSLLKLGRRVVLSY